MPERVWTESEIIALLSRNDDLGRRAVERAIVAIYDMQDPEEKVERRTTLKNGFGFDVADARKGSYFAGLVKSGHRLYKTPTEVARKMALKYRRQLLAVANCGIC